MCYFDQPSCMGVEIFMRESHLRGAQGIMHNSTLVLSKK